MAMIDVNAPNIVSIETGKYLIEYMSATCNRWGSCGMYVDRFGDRCDFKDEGARWVDAKFDDIVEAECYLNDLRNQNPRTEYRMVQPLTITQVIHA